MANWGIKFLQHANKKNVDHAAPYLRDLNLLSRDLYKELATMPGFDFALEQKGIIMYYKTEKGGERRNPPGRKSKDIRIGCRSFDTATGPVIRTGGTTGYIGRCALPLRCPFISQQINGTINSINYREWRRNKSQLQYYKYGYRERPPEKGTCKK